MKLADFKILRLLSKNGKIDVFKMYDKLIRYTIHMYVRVKKILILLINILYNKVAMCYRAWPNVFDKCTTHFEMGFTSILSSYIVRHGSKGCM